MSETYRMRLHVFAFGMAIGVSWAISMLLIGLSGHFFQTNTNLIASMGEMYVGFNATIGGSFIGALWGFIDGFIGGVVVAFLYNMFSKCCCKMKECCHKEKCCSNKESCEHKEETTPKL